MKLHVLQEFDSREKLQTWVNLYFGQAMRLCQEAISVLGVVYQVRPTRVHIPEVWKYRIYFKDGKYRFGKI